MPQTTTLRIGMGSEVHVSGRLAVGGSVAAHYWLRHDDTKDQVIVPLTLYGSLDLGEGFTTGLTSRNLVGVVNLDAPEERALHEVAMSIAREWTDDHLEASLSLPLDESLRDLDMFGVGLDYARSF